MLAGIKVLMLLQRAWLLPGGFWGILNTGHNTTKRHVSVWHVLLPFATYHVLDDLDPKQVES